MVRFENVGLRYGLGPEILRDLSFQIPAHSFQFLTGPSGAGKTSLLRLLFLSMRPTRGLVNLFGQDVSLLGKDEIANLRKRIGIVLQDFRLLDHMTTYENVALPFRVMGREESSYRREVIDLFCDGLTAKEIAARVTSKRSGSSNTVGSMFPARYDRYSHSPSAISTPATSVSTCAVRMKCRTGAVQRIISSTALGKRPGSAWSSRS